MDIQNRDLKYCSDKLIEIVIGCAIEVHKELGPGLLESAYELALLHELTLTDIQVRRQSEIPIKYKGTELGAGFRADLIVNDSLLLELKAVDEIKNIHRAQIITYLKLLNFKRGLLLNFNTVLLKDGIKRISI